MPVQAKICGLQDEASLHAALDGGAAMVGFVFYSLSKNAVTAELAQALAALVPAHVKKVGLFVDAGDDEIRQVLKTVPLDILQLHGVETPQRVAEIKRVTSVEVMKALRLKTVEQFAAIASYIPVADYLLFDSRIGDEASGGPLDWKWLKGHDFQKPWMLAGGLNAGNLEEAVRLSGAKAVDVSSGVEDAPYHKSPQKIREFLAVAARL